MAQRQATRHLMALLGRRAMQQSVIEPWWALAIGSRNMSSLPDHTVVGMPALSPTMTQGNLAKWHVKTGDALQPGSLLADVETDKASMPFENQDSGFVAKLLVEDGAKDLPLGTPLLVVVEEAGDVAAFANYTGSPSGAAAPGAVEADKQTPRPTPENAQQTDKSAAPVSQPKKQYPPHQVLGMPALSPTMTKGNVVSWSVKEGDSVTAGQAIGEIETDKATLAFEVQDEGVIAKILKPAGTHDVEINTPMVVLVDDAALVPEFKDFATANTEEATAAAPEPPTSQAAATPAEAPSAAPAMRPKKEVNSRVGPATRLLLETAGLSASDVTPTGPNDIVTKGDVLAAIAAGVKHQESASVATAAPAAASKPAEASPSSSKASTTPAPGIRESSYIDIPNSQIRKVIASRLLDSKRTTPALYGSTDVDLTALSALRKELGAQGIKVSVNDFVLKAVAQALEEVPGANCLWSSAKQEAVPASSVDISVAVATDKGLITPIVKSANTKTITQISKDVKELAAKAKANKLKPEEFQGGSFTVSNLGMFGITYFSAIINPPQGAIMAVGGTQHRVRLVDGKPKQIDVMTVTLSADHRVYDGELLGAVLEAFKKNIQAPAAMIF